MKKFTVRLAFVLALFILFSGCSSDSDSTECPQGFSGENCETKMLPSKIIVSKIVITQFPGFAPGNNDWDNGEDTSGDNPDLFIMIKENEELIYISPTGNMVVDAQNAFDHSFTVSPALELLQPLSLYRIALADYDGDLASSDMMVDLYSPVYDPLAPNFPDVITIANVEAGFSADFHVSYEW
jgi:hypothetical protein